MMSVRRMRRTAMPGAAVLVGTLFVPLAAGARPVSGVRVTSATADNGLTQQWRTFGRLPRVGWAAADGTYSTTLPSGLTVFLDNDTFFGPVNRDDSLPDGFHFTHNSAVLATPSGTPLLTVTAGRYGEPKSLVGPTQTDFSQPNAHWFWNGDGIVDGGALQVIEFRQEPTDADPPFNFAWTGTEIATLDPWTLTLRKETTVPSAGNIQWGVEMFHDDGWTYIYGVEGAGLTKYMHLARAREGHLTGNWQFRTADGWSTDPTSSARLLGNVGSSYSVTKVGRTYVLASFPSLLDPTIHTYTAPSPVGPFTHNTAVYTAPEAAQGLFAYNVAAHPELSRRGELVLSYNTNNVDTAALLKNIDENRPRFVDLHLSGI